MSFKIKDGVRIGTVDVFASNGQLLVPAPSLITPRNIALSGDVTGNVNFDGTANVTITTVIAPDSIALGTDTTGNYVANVAGSDGVTITGGGVETAEITVVNSDKGSSQNIFKNIAAGNGVVQFSAANNDDTIRFAGGGETGVTFDAATKTITINTAAPAVEADTLQSVTARGANTSVAVSFTNATSSSDTTTGAVVVAGGVGVGGALNVGGNISTNTGVLSTAATTASLFNAGATTLNIGGAATTVAIGAATGSTTINNSLVVSGNLVIQGETTTVNTSVLVVEDKNIELGATVTPTDTTANGGGITLKGDTDKTFNWVQSTAAWTASENLDLATGKEFKVNGTTVLSANTLGSGVLSSSLTSVGTIATGVWQGTAVGTAYGGTGQTTYSNGQILIGNALGTLTKATLTEGTNITITNSNGAITIAASGVVSPADNISNTDIIDSSHTTGRLITGQAFVSGINALTTLQKVTERGASTNNAITITNAAASSNTTTGALIVTGGIGVGNNVFVGGDVRTGVAHTGSVTTPISTVSLTAVDTFAAATYRSARYFVQITQGSNYQMSEVAILHNGTTTQITEYAVQETGGELCTFTADIDSGNVRLLATMASASAATIKMHRTLVTV